MTSFKRLIIDSIITDTPDTKTFVLVPETVSDAIDYKAGQFLTLVFAFENGYEERRSYSLSSLPLPGSPLAITVKRVPNGIYSRYLHDVAQPGDVLLTIGASGFFTLAEDMSPYRQLLFFAAGSGIVPILPLLQTVLQQYPGMPVVLVYSNRNQGSTIFYEQLLRLQQEYKDQLQIEFLQSSALNLARARLSKWLLETLLKEYLKVRPQQVLCYVCGPYDYMRMATIGLVDHDVPQQQIRKEDFMPLKIVPKILPPDTEAHQVTLHMASGDHQLTVQYPDTILKAARKAGLSLPYSCEAGRCGTCVARCSSGKVWMSYNEVLLDEEIAKGMVLTCTGYPVGGDARLEC